MRDDLNTLVEQIQAMPDSRLMEMLKDDPENYTPGTLSIAEAEVAARAHLSDFTDTTSTSSVESRGKQFGKTTGRIDTIFAQLIGHPKSDKYPGLSYVSIAMRVISILLGALAFGGSILAIAALFGQGIFGWIVTAVAAVQAGVGALLLYGGSELIKVILEIEKSMRGEA